MREESSAQMEKKIQRPRPVLSCVPCRHKKLKCNRESPCQQCERAQRSIDCTYNQNYLDPPAQTRASDEPELQRDRQSRGGKRVRVDSTTELNGYNSQEPVHIEKTGIIEDLQFRVANLERRLANEPHSSAPVRHCPDDRTAPSRGPSYMGTLSVEGTRSRYRGQYHRNTLLNQFDEAKAFVKKCAHDKELVAIVEGISSQQKRIDKNSKKANIDGTLDASAALSRMLDILPIRSICEKHVKVYLTYWEKVFRILHIPTFLEECERFWEAQDPRTPAFSSFVPQLIAVLAVAFSTDSGGFADRRSAEDLSQTCRDLVRAWLDSLNSKKRNELSALRAHTLVVLAEMMMMTPINKLWTATGTLVRSAMNMGLHRDPGDSTEFSIFQREMRRRIWVSIVELDLQTSLTHGMPTMVREGDFQCFSPANVNDIDLFEAMTELPESKPSHEFTDSLTQLILVKSLSRRLMALSIADRASLKMDSQEVLECGADLERSLEDFPVSLKFGSTERNEVPGLFFNQVMLNLYIRRTLLSLYRPLIFHKSREGSSAKARDACLGSSLAILNFQDALDPSIADLNVLKSGAELGFFQVLFKNDVVQAALNICLEIKIMGDFVLSTDTDIFSPSTQALSRNQSNGAWIGASLPRAPYWTKANLTRVVKSTIDSLMRRINDFGSDIKNILILSAILQSVRMSSSREDQEALMREGVESVLQACRQQFLPNFGNVSVETRGSENTNNTVNQLAHKGESPKITDLTGPGGNSNGIASLDLDYFLYDYPAFGEVDFGFGPEWDFDPP